MRRPIAGPAARLLTYRLVVEYDGTGFSGWQVQKNARTVVGELDRALREAGVRPVDLGGSGRTDAGVHALAQVAHLRVERPVDAPAVLAAMADLLPAGIHLHALEPAPRGFHARHDAVSRVYLYQLARRRTAFAKRFVWWVRQPLDLEAMRHAATAMAGRHDFALFCHRVGEQESTQVEVEAVELVEDGDLVLVRLSASHFLWRMVRRVVGALVQAGSGALSIADLERLLEGAPVAELEPARWTAPSSGLFLERVLYAGDPPLAPPRAVTPLPTLTLPPVSGGKRGGRHGPRRSRRREPGDGGGPRRA